MNAVYKLECNVQEQSSDKQAEWCGFEPFTLANFCERLECYCSQWITHYLAISIRMLWGFWVIVASKRGGNCALPLIVVIRVAMYKVAINLTGAGMLLALSIWLLMCFTVLICTKKMMLLLCFLHSNSSVRVTVIAVQNYTVFHKKHPLSFFVISHSNVVQWQWKLEQIFI